MRIPSLAALVVCLGAVSAVAQAPCNTCPHGNADGWRPVGRPTTTLQPPTDFGPSMLPPGSTVPPIETSPTPFSPPSYSPVVPGPTPEFQPNLPSMPGPSLSSPGLTGAAFANNPGRMDSNNRLNIFDNYSAIPTSRLWIGYQVTDRQRSDVRLVNGSSAADFAALNNGQTVIGDNGATLLRAGGEFAFTPRFSIALQGQYTWPGDDNGAQEDWTNPQLLFKHVLKQDRFTTISGVFGIAIEAGSDTGVINDASTRVIPGVLFYHDLAPDLFTQGGASFSFASRNDTNTFDWSLGLGWWAYRTPYAGLPRYQQFDHCVDAGPCCGGRRRWGGCGRRGCGRCGGGCNRCDEKWIRGIAPGIYLFGKHAMNDNDRLNAFGLTYTDAFGNEVAKYEEGRHIIDMTLGGTVLLKHNLSMNLGYSFPLTGPRARNNEFLMALNWNY